MHVYVHSLHGQNKEFCSVLFCSVLFCSVPPVACGRWCPQTCSLQSFLCGSSLLLKDTDQPVGVGVPDSMVELMVSLYPVVRSDRLAEDVPHVDREVAFDLTTHSRCCM